tara:strand:+ start:1870 stop:3597 length:1728 start_codon:yes stop_codon:yes gene_type:complete
MLKSIKNIFYPLDKKDYYKLLFLFVLILIGTVLELLSISLIIPILTIFVGEDYLRFAKYLFFIDFENKIQVLSFVLILFLIIYFLKLLVVTGLLYFQTTFAFSLYTKISKKMFQKYLNETYLFHIVSNSSNLLRNVISESNMFSFGLILPLVKLISDLIIFTSISCLLIIYSLTTSLIAIVFISLSSYIIFKLTSFNLRNIGSSRQFHSAKMIKQVNQALGSIKEIILYNLQSFFLEKFTSHNQEYARSGKLKNIIIDFPRIILEFVIVLIFIIAIFFLINDNKVISEIIVILGVFAFASFRLLPTIVKIIKSFQTIKYNLPVLDLIYNEFEEARKKTNKNISDKLNNNFKFKNLNLNNLNYFYKSNNDKKIILSDINLNINCGDKIGIKGKTGSGKTTLINLIIGLLGDYEGKIELNDKDLEDNIFNLQNKIGYVPQSVYLADETILFNITLDHKKNVDYEKLSKILSLVELSDFINNLPENLNTVIGERGGKLSGGQCQRIGIARALYRDPSIIVLDEATSSLDEQTENKILNKLFQNSLDKTVIIISHRNNSFIHCDKIYEIKNKNLTEFRN